MSRWARALRRIQQYAAGAWFAYLTIFLLQLKIVWDIWLVRDLALGDTSYYFSGAYSWFRDWHVYFLWSPLYTAFYGTLLYVSRDAYIVTIAHRLIIVLGLAVLVLALMRRLLPAGIAWVMAAWWAVLPVDFDALYEVHLFALFPVLAACLILFWAPGARGRGWALAILVASTILVRNELLVATLAFAALCILWDIRRGGNRAATGIPVWRSYGLPLVVCSVVIAGAFARSVEPSVSAALSAKQAQNLCQSYAFGYRQRHNDWNGEPGSECEQLMSRVFGKAKPSLTEAYFRNPAALLEHYSWNIGLIPNGLQVVLFNAMSGTVTPDYHPVRAKAQWALLASVLAGAVLAAGLLLLYRDRRLWWNTWLRDRMWAWLLMGCIGAVAVIVMITQRPRPSYLLGFGIFLRAAIGMSVFAIGSRWPPLQRLRYATPAVALLLICAVPRYYGQTGAPPIRGLLELYRILQPFQDRMSQSATGLVAARWTQALCSYLSPSDSAPPCRAIGYDELRDEVGAGASWDKVLARHDATLFLADAAVLADPLGCQFVQHAPAYGWRTIASETHLWAVLDRAPPGSLAVSAGSTPKIEPDGTTAALSPSGRPPVYYVDRLGDVVNPAPNQAVIIPVSGCLTLKGWAIDAAGESPVRGVDVVVDGKPYRAHCGHSREDVAEHFHRPAYEKAGFMFSLPAAVAGPGKHAVAIRMVSGDGKTYTEAPGFTVEIR